MWWGSHKLIAGITQLVRVPFLHEGSCWFESDYWYSEG